MAGALAAGITALVVLVAAVAWLPITSEVRQNLRRTRRQFDGIATELGLVEVAGSECPRFAGKRGGIPWAIELGSAVVDPDLHHGEALGYLAVEAVATPAVPTCGSLIPLPSGRYALTCDFTVEVRLGQRADVATATRLNRRACAEPLPVSEVDLSPDLPMESHEIEALRKCFEYVTSPAPLEQFRASMERAGVWADLVSISAQQAPFTLNIYLEVGEVVAVLPLTRQLDASVVARVSAALASWRSSMLHDDGAQLVTS